MPVTLGGYLVVLGITYILGHSKSVIYENYTVGLRLDKPILQIFSIRSLVALGIFVVAALVLRYLRVGRDIRAIGGDRRAARVAGVSVDRLLIGVFVISALGAALPGALLSYSLATASPTNIGFDVLTFSATAALIGGVSLSGGKGGAVGIAAGVLSLSVLQEILAILRSPDYVSSLITGGLLVLFTIVWAPDLGQWFRTTRVAAAVEERARDRGAHQIRLDPDPLEPYLLSQGFRVGDLVIVSGQAALDEHGDIVGAGDFDAQAEQVFRNLARVLEAGGSSLDRVVKVTIFLTDMTNFGKIVELPQALVHTALPGGHDRRGERARASRAADRDRGDRHRRLNRRAVAYPAVRGGTASAGGTSARGSEACSPVIEFRNSRSPEPSERPISGSFFGPKRSTARPSRRTISMGPMSAMWPP